MLDRNKVSDNEVYVSGILNELEITEGKTKDGRDYVRGTASIRVDQDIDGKVSENVIPVKMFAMRKKNDGSDNPVYDRIVGYKNQFTSLAAAESEAEASWVTVSNGTLEENAWFDARTNAIRTGFQINANFINKKKDTDKEQAIFILNGIVGKMRPEISKKTGEETGRLIVDFVIMTWGGKANKIELIAQDGKKEFIENNWNEQDTVTVKGCINMSYKVEEVEIPLGFGDPIIKPNTVSIRELVITGGSPTGLEEALSYDIDSVKTALSERLERHEALKNAPSNSKASTKNKAVDFGF